MVKPHPAPYTKGFEKHFARLLTGCNRIIDPMGGIGEIGRIKGEGFSGLVFMNELEAEWAVQGINKCDVVTIGDARHLSYPDNYFRGSVTSCVYGNRMSDHHKARDKSKRNTYTHYLERDLTPGNTGAMQFTGKRKTSLLYATTHKEIWTDLRRVLEDGRVFVLNVSDHIRKGRRVRTTLWHILCLKSLGYELLEHIKVPTPRNRFGANGDKRVAYESILVFRLRKER